jgi:hypothetical protein
MRSLNRYRHRQKQPTIFGEPTKYQESLQNPTHMSEPTDTSAESIPTVVFNAAVENAATGDQFAVICTDGDIEYVQTREEAEQVAQEMRAMREFFAGPSHATEIIEL